MTNHPHRNAKKLAKLLRREINSICVPRSVTNTQCSALVRAGLIRDVTGAGNPDTRYEATDYARDLIYGRI